MYITGPTDDDELDLALIIGLSVGVAVLLIIIFVLLFCCFCPCCPLYRKCCRRGEFLKCFFQYGKHCYFAPGRGAKYCDEYVCLFVCLIVSLWACITRENHTAELHRSFCACYLWPCLGHLLTALRYDTICTSGLWMTSCFYIMALWRVFLSGDRTRHRNSQDSNQILLIDKDRKYLL